MSTSGVWTMGSTGTLLIAGALKDLGVIEESETPTSAQQTDGLRYLNLILKSWAGEGLGLFTEKDITVFLQYETASFLIGPSGANATLSYLQAELTADSAALDTTMTIDDSTGMTGADYVGVELDAGTLHWTTIASVDSSTQITLTAGVPTAAATGNWVYTYTTKCQRPTRLLDEAIIRNSDETDSLVTMISRKEYRAIADKSSSGTPNNFHYLPTLTNGTLYVWPTTSDVKNRLIVTGKYQFQDMNAVGDDVELPVEWHNALQTALAVRFAPSFGKGVQEMQLLIAMAADAKAALELGDSELSSVFMGPGR